MALMTDKNDNLVRVTQPVTFPGEKGTVVVYQYCDDHNEEAWMVKANPRVEGNEYIACFYNQNLALSYGAWFAKHGFL